MVAVVVLVAVGLECSEEKREGMRVVFIGVEVEAEVEVEVEVAIVAVEGDEETGLETGEDTVVLRTPFIVMPIPLP